MKESNTLVLRYPYLGKSIINSGILCFLVFLMTYPTYLMIPQKTTSTSFVGYVVGCFFFILFFYLFVLIPLELIFLNLSWRKFTFDKSAKLLIVRKYIFFFVLGKPVEIKFDQIKNIQVNHEFMFGSAVGGVQLAASGYVWHLYLITQNRRYILGRSIFKRFLDNKREFLSKFINLSFQAPSASSEVICQEEMPSNKKPILNIVILISVILMVIMKVAQPFKPKKELDNDSVSINSCMNTATNNFIYRKQIACQKLGEKSNCVLPLAQIQDIELLRMQEIEICNKSNRN